MVTPYFSEILEREEKKQSNNQSVKPGFQYFNTLIDFGSEKYTIVQKISSDTRKYGKCPSLLHSYCLCVWLI